MNQTERLINRIKEKESFFDVAWVCEDFETFVIEISEWGVEHIAGVDLVDTELDHTALNDFFGSFGCTPSHPHPCSNYMLGV